MTMHNKNHNDFNCVKSKTDFIIDKANKDIIGRDKAIIEMNEFEDELNESLRRIKRHKEMLSGSSYTDVITDEDDKKPTQQTSKNTNYNIYGALKDIIIVILVIYTLYNNVPELFKLIESLFLVLSNILKINVKL